jgi:hypothetical protein
MSRVATWNTSDTTTATTKKKKKMPVSHRWTRDFERTRCRERAWFASTVVCSSIAVLATIFWLSYSYVLISGVRQSIHHLESSDALIRFTRLAWMGKHGCAGNEEAIINVHCPTVAKWIADKTEIEPVALAANQSYYELVESLDAYSNASYTVEYFTRTLPSVDTWIRAHLWMDWCASTLLLPSFSFACFAAMFGLLWVMPWLSLRFLRSNVSRRRELIKQSTVRSFSDSLATAETTTEGFPHVDDQTQYTPEGSTATPTGNQFPVSWFDIPVQAGVRKRRVDGIEL